MSAKITLTGATFSQLPGINQTVTVAYRRQSDPDVPGSYTTVTTNQVINTAGVFVPARIIGGLLNGVAYVVRVTNNCNNLFVDKVYNTPLPSCVNLVDIIGTTAEE